MLPARDQALGLCLVCIFEFSFPGFGDLRGKREQHSLLQFSDGSATHPALISGARGTDLQLSCNRASPVPLLTGLCK